MLAPWTRLRALGLTEVHRASKIGDPREPRPAEVRRTEEGEDAEVAHVPEARARPRPQALAQGCAMKAGTLLTSVSLEC